MNITTVRSDRRSVSIEIARNGELTVRAPRRMSDSDVAAFIESRRAWIERRLEQYSADVEAARAETALDTDALMRIAKVKLSQRVEFYAKIMGAEYGKITVRQQKTLWGSCTRDGNLSFNCLLAAAPERVLDYVVVHELCHIKNQSHSAKFWQAVASIMPDYAEYDRWLRENGRVLFLRCDGACTDRETNSSER